jgi:UPF0176 protein
MGYGNFMMNNTYTIAALYRFVSIEDVPSLQIELKNAFSLAGICGTLLIASEGINGTLAGSASAIEEMLGILEQKTGLKRDEVKFSYSEEKPFQKLKVRQKKEIITFRQLEADPNIRVGQYVEPKDWNDLIAQPDIIVLDTRNVYETMVGTFKNAGDPKIEIFTQFADFVRGHLSPEKHKKIAMFCTGGIRCEKASAFMLAEGYEEVYHLKGGILKYLEEIPPEESQWEGACYVFDRRMAVGHGLKTGKHSMCYSCGYALTSEDKEHPHYEEGVSCAYCHNKTSSTDKERFRTRHQQWVSENCKAHTEHA